MTDSKSEVGYDFQFKVVLIGDAGVGKTSVFRRFKTGSFAPRRGSTIENAKHSKTLQIDGKQIAVFELIARTLKNQIEREGVFTRIYGENVKLETSTGSARDGSSSGCGC